MEFFAASGPCRNNYVPATSQTFDYSRKGWKIGAKTRVAVDDQPEKRYPASLLEVPLQRGCSSVDRVLASEAKGRGFDPRQPHHHNQRFILQLANASRSFPPHDLDIAHLAE
jgi:hypothetical protein